MAVAVSTVSTVPKMAEKMGGNTCAYACSVCEKTMTTERNLKTLCSVRGHAKPGAQNLLWTPKRSFQKGTRFK